MDIELQEALITRIYTIKFFELMKNSSNYVACMFGDNELFQKKDLYQKE